jgi:hypothetical protein
MVVDHYLLMGRQPEIANHLQLVGLSLDKFNKMGEKLTCPYGRHRHPREEHLLPVLVLPVVVSAAAGTYIKPILSINIDEITNERQPLLIP